MANILSSLASNYLHLALQSWNNIFLSFLSGFLRVCIYCHNVVQHYTQSSELNPVRNLEQLQADFSTDPELSASNSSNMNLNVSKVYPFDFEDDENFYGQPTLRKISSASGTGMSSYYEKLEPKDRPPPMSGRRPFDAFGVCAAEADMLKQVGGTGKPRLSRL